MLASCSRKSWSTVPRVYDDQSTAKRIGRVCLLHSKHIHHCVCWSHGYAALLALAQQKLCTYFHKFKSMSIRRENKLEPKLVLGDSYRYNDTSGFKILTLRPVVCSFVEGNTHHRHHHSPVLPQPLLARFCQNNSCVGLYRVTLALHVASVKVWKQLLNNWPHFVIFDRKKNKKP